MHQDKYVYTAKEQGGTHIAKLHYVLKGVGKGLSFLKRHAALIRFFLICVKQPF